jgi:hypothetical protein
LCTTNDRDAFHVVTLDDPQVAAAVALDLEVVTSG